ncbi:MAG: hypothetical protein J6B85_02975 [Lachnospiraceae bacterium]|nr:hypothetical protein [Lachnospiraceae bacterium]
MVEESAKAMSKETAVSEQELQEAAARERREQQKAKVRMRPVSMIDEDEEEEDEILRALDRYFDDTQGDSKG